MRFCFRSAIKLLLNFLQRCLQSTWTVRESCAGILLLVCLLIIPVSERSQLPKRWPALNGQTMLKAFHGSIQTRLRAHPVTIVTAYSTLLFHCINIHIDITCNDGSIKRGAARSQICQVSFQIRRHGPAFALHATFKIKSAKGLRNPDLFRRDLCLCACLVFCHVFLINACQLASYPTRHIFISIPRVR